MGKENREFLKYELKKLYDDFDNFSDVEISKQLLTLKNVISPIDENSIEELNLVSELISTSKETISNSLVISSDSVTIKRKNFEKFKSLLLKLSKVSSRYNINPNYGYDIEI